MTAQGEEMAAKKLLLVEDDPQIRGLVNLLLRREDIQITEAADGGETMQYLANETYDVILLDIMMPVMDGYEVLRRIRTETINAHTPVVILTSRAQDADILKGYALGATLYITKPFEPEDLVAQVHQLLGLN